MRIAFVEIQNFRKLRSVHIDFEEKETLFVGANNSGKTSAMVALRLFLMSPGKFSLSDFTLSHWAKLNAIGADWETDEFNPNFSEHLKDDWEPLLPSLDLWIEAQKDELHYVSHILPSLNWTGEPLGIRFRYEPNNLEELYKDYLTAINARKDALRAANENKRKGRADYSVPLWPVNLQEFLSRSGRLNSYFTIRSYILNPKRRTQNAFGVITPQTLEQDAEPLVGNPLAGLIQIDEIDAQRGFSDVGSGSQKSGDSETSGVRVSSGKLSSQLSRYYEHHLDPSDVPDPDDMEAMEGIAKAQQSFDERLDKGFEKALSELEQLGYPGLTDPKLSVRSKIEPLHAMRHASAVQYDVIASTENGMAAARLPEQSSGLGYQNLISIVFRLISFRDDWMKTGKAARKLSPGMDNNQKHHPPLHLVLIEEPEAHLHAQVQQVFIRKAYAVLRNHEDLGTKKNFVTQLVVSTHSNHVVYESNFAALRYFRRLPATTKGVAPTSHVVNLTGIFGKESATEKFETRYIRTTHCDLFFADAIVLVEGAAERMFLPHFLREHFNGGLYQRYVSILEIGGSHAHRLRPLIEALALPTLIVTDLDSGKKNSSDQRVSGCAPERGSEMVTMNDTLKGWVPKLEDLDELLDVDESMRIVKIDEFSAVYAAYQLPISLVFKPNARGSASKKEEALAYTFEDALALENLEIFRSLEGAGLIGKFREAIKEAENLKDLTQKFYASVKNGDKGKFALDVIFGVDPSKLVVPGYISSGLRWLEAQLAIRDEQNLISKVSTGKKPLKKSKNEARA
jgi:predicted ATP-dependent endonuclease of OLD family